MTRRVGSSPQTRARANRARDRRANHSEKAVRRDFEINREFPHRFLAFHDILGTNRWTVGVKRFWDSLNEGHKQEICRPHAELGLETSTMGIGVWSEVLP